MQLRNQSQTYGLITKLIHWTTALLILGLLFVGFYMTSLPFSEDKMKIYMLHKSFGLLVLMLVFVRVAWHLLSRKPRSLDTHAPWEKFLAHAAHTFLYFAMFAMPISGWIMSSAGDFTVQFFGFKLPDIVEKNENLFKSGQQVHETIAFVLIAVVGLHMAGAFKHHFIDRDKTLKRMTSENVGFGVGAVLVLLAAVMMLPTLFLVGKDMLHEFSEEDGMQVAVQETVEGNLEDNIKQSTPIVEGAWTIDHDNSKIQFEAMQYGQSFEGRFEKFDGEIIFSPDTLDKSKALIRIDIASIKTGSSDRDTQATTPDWFDTTKYPQAVFETQSFEMSGENQYIAHGTLTIRDVSLPLDLPFTLSIEKKENERDRAKMKAEISLNRLDFGIGQGQWKSTEAIGNTVKIKIEVEALQ